VLWLGNVYTTLTCWASNKTEAGCFSKTDRVAGEEEHVSKYSRLVIDCKFIFDTGCVSFYII